MESLKIQAEFGFYSIGCENWLFIFSLHQKAVKCHKDCTCLGRDAEDAEFQDWNFNFNYYQGVYIRPVPHKSKVGMTTDWQQID